MEEELGPSKINLQNNRECIEFVAICPNNAETSTENKVVMDIGGYHIIPKVYVDHVTRYLEERLAKNGISVDKTHGRHLKISLEDITCTLPANLSKVVQVKLKFEIPETGFVQAYTAEEGSGLVEYATAYSTHLAIDQLLKDPNFATKRLCKN